jgi:hypothetical protein
MKSKLTKLAAAGALTLSATAAFAGSTTQPGITIGGSAAPLPPGLYFSDTLDWGVRNIQGTPVKEAVGVNAPVLAWSTPWQILGARLILAAALPSIEVGFTGLGNGLYEEGMFNPFVGGTLAWSLGGGFAFAYTAGGYFKINSAVAQDANTFEQRASLSYLGGGWNLTATAIYGINDKHVSLTSNTVTNPTPDYFNLDVAVIKNFGKWEVGAVGFGSADLCNAVALDCNKQRQIALGALLGYNWGPVITQAYLTRDVWQENYRGFDTRVWARIIVPLGDPFAPAAAPMYHK